MDKRFFIGQRSLKILGRKPLKRSLVGFTASTSSAGKIEECHLIIDQGQIIGRVTSVAHSPILERVIGLAFIAPERARAGTPFQIRLDDGRFITATVTEPPFYDPENRRQAQTS
jgi:sarcosine oxidase subunit alpha